ncbi:MAG: RNA-binding S4 domain-containing protein [Bacteriovoracaceae bacterium]|jgi:ribosome-associated protein|nr:RNA-binding S4 domain-containing protein [Bacteriovoracaceae bacterium]
MEEFKLEGREYIALCDLLKRVGLCESGGHAKQAISEGQAVVDGEVELRKRCKIRPMQVVEFAGQTVKVVN